MRTFLLAALLALSGCADARPQDYALRLEMGVGPIPVPSRVCSGTAVGPQLILSASHCFVGATALWVDGVPVKVLKTVEDGRDHTLLRVDRKFKRWAKVRPGAVVGGTVRWVGNPAWQHNVHRRGYVARVTAEEIYLDAQLYGGDSGSGVYSRGGWLRMVISAVRVWQDERGVRMALAIAYPIEFTPEQWREVQQ